MTTKEQVNVWVRQYGLTGGKIFHLNPNGTFAARDSDDQEYVVNVPEASAYVYFCAPIVTLTDSTDIKKSLEFFLRLNLWGHKTYGSTLALEDDSQRILLYRRFLIEDLDEYKFIKAFDLFIAAVRNVQKIYLEFTQNNGTVMEQALRVDTNLNPMLRI